LIVADACNHRLGRFTLDGRLVKWIGSPDEASSDLGRLKYPYGIALLPGRTALVVEYGNNRVQHLDLETGLGLATYGRTGRGTGELAVPWGVALVGGTAYVLDSGNNRVMGFDAPASARRADRDRRGEHE
jgi:DNA-binding beta-propeller fold protein YncE